MRRPSSRIRNRRLTVRKQTYQQDTAGGRTQTSTSAAQYDGSLQPVSANRVPDHLRASAAIDTMALFAEDPGVEADDLIEGPDGTVMHAAAPALDQGGRGSCWIVYGVRKS